jgi:hypothetical protein
MVSPFQTHLTWLIGEGGKHLSFFDPGDSGEAWLRSSARQVGFEDLLLAALMLAIKKLDGSE